MARAAVPNYVGLDFDTCPPGHRFNLYFKVWPDNFKEDLHKDQLKALKTPAVREALSCVSSNALLAGLRDRQKSLATSSSDTNTLVIDAKSTSPFATGLGLEHPVENGFAFLTPYGMPYLAGSGVKGVARHAATELRNLGTDGFDDAIYYLFGPDPDSDEDAQRGALSFWDVFPVPANERLAVEVMTPHSSHYLQDGRAPHDAGKPNPIPFLAVPAGSEFRFIVTCEPSLLPAALRPRWKPLLMAILQHAFDWLGFGAKTAVGYGALSEDPAAKQRREAEADAIRKQAADAAAQAEREEILKALSPAQREIREFLDARMDHNMPEIAALTSALKQGKWSGDMKVAVAQHLETLMRAARRWKDRSEKKNPDKDHDYQATLLVGKWLKGE